MPGVRQCRIRQYSMFHKLFKSRRLNIDEAHREGDPVNSIAPVEEARLFSFEASENRSSRWNSLPTSRSASNRLDTYQVGIVAAWWIGGSNGIVPRT